MHLDNFELLLEKFDREWSLGREIYLSLEVAAAVVGHQWHLVRHQMLQNLRMYSSATWRAAVYSCGLH